MIFFSNNTQQPLPLHAGLIELKLKGSVKYEETPIQLTIENKKTYTARAIPFKAIKLNFIDKYSRQPVNGTMWTIAIQKVKILAEGISNAEGAGIAILNKTYEAET